MFEEECRESQNRLKNQNIICKDEVTVFQYCIIVQPVNIETNIEIIPVFQRYK